MDNKEAYTAFLSYAHADDDLAKRLQKSLETYRIPKDLRVRDAKTFYPIFRDATELTAHFSLSEKIKSAILESGFLIVLCSPAAKASTWVNEEIRLFRAAHGSEKILCALIEGTPATAFPDALLDEGEEPLAAKLFGGKDDFSLGLSQLAASLLGVGLERIIKRERQRNRNRVITVTAGALLICSIFAVLTAFAFDAQKQAEQRRNDAEAQIEFMITDLKDKLDAVGRLDALDDVGNRAVAYYDNYPLNAHDDDALGRRARVFHFLGEVQNNLGQVEHARTYFEKAYQATEALLRRSPANADRVFEHAQSAFWRGHAAYLENDLVTAKDHFQDYLDLAVRLQTLEGGALRTHKELGYAYSNMGAILSDLGKIGEAVDYLTTAQEYKRRVFAKTGQGPSEAISLSATYAQIARLALRNNDLSHAQLMWSEADSVVADVEKTDPENAQILMTRLTYARIQARLNLYGGDYRAAEDDLKRGLNIAAHIAQIEGRHRDLRFEELYLSLIQIERALFENETATAQDYLRDARLDLKALPADLATDYSYLEIEAALMMADIYIASANADFSSLTSALDRLDRWMDAQDLSEETVVQTHPFVLSAVIVSHAANPASEKSALIRAFCEAPAGALEYGTRIALDAPLDRLENCPNRIDAPTPSLNARALQFLATNNHKQ